MSLINRIKGKHWRRVPELVRCVRSTSDWRKVISAYVAKKNLRYPYTLPVGRNGTLLIEDWDELSTFWHVFCCGEYDVPSNCKSIIDLGANIGAFTLWASRRCPKAKIIAVEPFPSTFERLSTTIRDNRLSERATAMNIAVGAKNGMAKFDATVGKRSYCRSLIEGASNTESIEVPCLSLESLLDQAGLEHIDCLKMDVEGGEYAIFDGANAVTLRRCKIITMEYHDQQKAPRLWEKLEASGFHCTRKVSAGWSGLATYVRKETGASLTY